MRNAFAFTLIAAGIVWSVMFPKKATFDFDMVDSVALGLGLISTGTIVLLAKRWRWGQIGLVTLLIWSLLANVCLLNELRQVSDLLRRLDHH